MVATPRESTRSTLVWLLGGVVALVVGVLAALIRTQSLPTGDPALPAVRRVD